MTTDAGYSTESSFAGSVLPKTKTLSPSAFGNVSSRKFSYASDDFASLRRTDVWKTSIDKGIEWGIKLTLLKIGIDIALFSFLRFILNVNFWDQKFFYSYGILDVVLSFSLFSFGATLAFNTYLKRTFLSEFFRDGQKVEVVKPPSGQLEFLAGSSGIAIEGENVTLTFDWDRIDSIFAGTRFDGQDVASFLAESDDDNDKIDEIILLKKNHLSEIAALGNDGVISIRLRKLDPDLKAFEEIVVPKRFFNNDHRETSWANFYLDLLKFMYLRRLQFPYDFGD